MQNEFEPQTSDRAAEAEFEEFAKCFQQRESGWERANRISALLGVQAPDYNSLAIGTWKTEKARRRSLVPDGSALSNVNDNHASPMADNVSPNSLQATRTDQTESETNAAGESSHTGPCAELMPTHYADADSYKITHALLLRTVHVELIDFFKHLKRIREVSVPL